MKKILDKLPKRFQWTLHNCIAHPLMEIAFQCGLKNLSTQIHEMTQPTDEDQCLNADSDS